MRERTGDPLSSKRRELLDSLLANVQEGAGARVRPSIPRLPDRSDCPLSFAQERMWFLDQLQPGTALYNVDTAIRMQGWLEPALLERSFNEIVRRHEVLRTRFPARDGKPVQAIADRLHVPLNVADFRGLPPHQKEADAVYWSAWEARQPFNLADGPLIRTSLIRLWDLESILLITLHHIIADGWSLGVLMREVGAIYQAYLQGMPSPLPELPVQYADFASWQRTTLRGDALQEQLEYWKRQLAGLPPMLQLPTDHPRPAVKTFKGALELFSVEPAVVGRLRALGREESATLFMILLSAFVVLLCRYTRQTDVAVGSPIANRTREDIEGLIGFFVNTLVLRVDLAGNPTIRELLRRVRAITLGAYAHQDLPFERLVEELQPERNLSHNPLFEVMFLLQNTPGRAERQRDPLELREGVPAPPKVEVGTAKFDLMLAMGEVGDGVNGTLEYSTDLFEAQTMRRMASHLKTLLAAIAADPDRRVGELELMPAEERRQIVNRSKGERREFRREALVHQLFEEQVLRRSDAEAIRYEDRSLSYAELNRRANRLAHRLKSMGIKAESPVGIEMERSPEMVVAVLGVLKAGGAYVPLDPAYPAERLEFMRRDARIVALIRDREMGEEVGVPVVTLTGTEAVEVDDDRNPPPVAQPDNLAYIIYTSGSTGRPKGLAMPHRPLMNLLQYQVSAHPAPPASTTMLFASLSFDVSFQEILSTLASGGVLAPVPETAKKDPAAVLDLCRERNCRQLFLPPVALRQLCDVNLETERWPTSLREVFVAGEALQVTPKMMRFFERTGASLVNQYGPTETHVVTEFRLRGASPAEWPARPSIGRPIYNAAIYILQDNLEPSPVGTPGELYIGGDVLARGYFDRPELTADRFVPDPFSESPGARMYRTGDLARYHADGNIEYIERTDRQLKVRGYRIESGEIENVLMELPGVREAQAVVAGESPEDARLIAYVVSESDSVSGPGLRAELKRTLPEFMVPAAVVSVPSMPLTANGKLDRSKLPVPDYALREPAHAYCAPRNDVEEQIAATWSEILKVERIGVHDNFFDLGGHSLLATQVVSRMSQTFQTKLPLQALFEAPTVAQLAVAILELQLASMDRESVERVFASLG